MLVLAPPHRDATTRAGAHDRRRRPGLRRDLVDGELLARMAIPPSLALLLLSSAVSETSSHGNRLWSVTEVPGRRMLFWVYTSEM
jgi:hypothetical protein